VDFLAKFADVTGADFHELLRLRLASGKTPEARALAETLVPIEPIKTPDDLEDKLEELGKWLDDLVEGAEIDRGDEGECLPFLAEEPRTEFLNQIKKILLFGVALSEEEKEVVSDKTAWSASSVDVDPKLMAEIVARLEQRFLASPAAALAMHRFMVSNRDQVRAFLNGLKDPQRPEDIEIEGLLSAISKTWIRYAGGEAGAAAYIYNRVSSLQDIAERTRVIDSETTFFVEYRMLDIALDESLSK
jgi:hypothetical protein